MRAFYSKNLLNYELKFLLFILCLINLSSPFQKILKNTDPEESCLAVGLTSPKEMGNEKLLYSTTLRLIPKRDQDSRNKFLFTIYISLRSFHATTVTKNVATFRCFLLMLVVVIVMVIQDMLIPC